VLTSPARPRSGLDALWAGLPLLTAAGGNMARRCGASFLISQALTHSIARSPQARWTPRPPPQHSPLREASAVTQ
jgi:hypothetical protein